MSSKVKTSTTCETYTTSGSNQSSCSSKKKFVKTLWVTDGCNEGYSSDSDSEFSRKIALYQTTQNLKKLLSKPKNFLAAAEKSECSPRDEKLDLTKCSLMDEVAARKKCYLEAVERADRVQKCYEESLEGERTHSSCRKSKKYREAYFKALQIARNYREAYTQVLNEIKGKNRELSSSDESSDEDLVKKGPLSTESPPSTEWEESTDCEELEEMTSMQECEVVTECEDSMVGIQQSTELVRKTKKVVKRVKRFKKKLPPARPLGHSKSLTNLDECNTQMCKTTKIIKELAASITELMEALPLKDLHEIKKLLAMVGDEDEDDYVERSSVRSHVVFKNGGTATSYVSNYRQSSNRGGGCGTSVDARSECGDDECNDYGENGPDGCFSRTIVVEEETREPIKRCKKKKKKRRRKKNGNYCFPFCDTTCVDKSQNVRKWRNKYRNDIASTLRKSILDGQRKCAKDILKKAYVCKKGEPCGKPKLLYEQEEPIVVPMYSSVNKRREKRCLHAGDYRKDQSRLAACFAPACEERVDFRKTLGVDQIRCLFPLLSRMSRCADVKVGRRLTPIQLYCAVKESGANCNFSFDRARAVVDAWGERVIPFDECLFAIQHTNYYLKICKFPKMLKCTLDKWAKNPFKVEDSCKLDFKTPRSVYDLPKAWAARLPREKCKPEKSPFKSVHVTRTRDVKRVRKDVCPPDPCPAVRCKSKRSTPARPVNDRVPTISRGPTTVCSTSPPSSIKPTTSKKSKIKTAPPTKSWRRAVRNIYELDRLPTMREILNPHFSGSSKSKVESRRRKPRIQNSNLHKAHQNLVKQLRQFGEWQQESYLRKFPQPRKLKFDTGKFNRALRIL